MARRLSCSKCWRWVKASILVGRPGLDRPRAARTSSRGELDLFRRAGTWRFPRHSHPFVCDKQRRVWRWQLPLPPRQRPWWECHSPWLRGSSPIPTGTVTLRAKVRWLRGWPEMLFRLHGNHAEATGRLALLIWHAGGAEQSPRSTNAAPAIWRPARSAGDFSGCRTGGRSDHPGRRSGMGFSRWPSAIASTLRRPMLRWR